VVHSWNLVWLSVQAASAHRPSLRHVARDWWKEAVPSLLEQGIFISSLLRLSRNRVRLSHSCVCRAAWRWLPRSGIDRNSQVIALHVSAGDCRISWRQIRQTTSLSSEYLCRRLRNLLLAATGTIEGIFAVQAVLGIRALTVLANIRDVSLRIAGPDYALLVLAVVAFSAIPVVAFSGRDTATREVPSPKS